MEISISDSHLSFLHATLYSKLLKRFIFLEDDALKTLQVLSILCSGFSIHPTEYGFNVLLLLFSPELHSKGLLKDGPLRVGYLLLVIETNFNGRLH